MASWRIGQSEGRNLLSEKAPREEVETAVPDSLVGSGAEFERSKGIHLLPEPDVLTDRLPPPAAVTVQPEAQGASPAESTPPSAEDSSD